MNHKAEAIIITCIDFRLQEAINQWISQNFAPQTFDRVALAGGVKNLDIILGQIEIAKRLHDIHRAILINHEDCGAYGDPPAGGEKHAQDLQNAKAKILSQFPDLTVGTYYLKLNGAFVIPSPA